MIDDAKRLGLSCMLAGSLRFEELSVAWQCGAEIIGIRSAVCYENSRKDGIDPAKLSELYQHWLH
jgi:uncharacterized protein (UPF0264 family)